jgi:hypothetical protein
VGALSTLAAAAYSLSLPKESVLKYDLAIETDDEFLLMAHGTASEAAMARAMISAVRADELGTPSSALLRLGPARGRSNRPSDCVEGGAPRPSNGARAQRYGFRTPLSPSWGQRAKGESG